MGWTKTTWKIEQRAPTRCDRNLQGDEQVVPKDTVTTTSPKDNHMPLLAKLNNMMSLRSSGRRNRKLGEKQSSEYNSSWATAETDETSLAFSLQFDEDEQVIRQNCTRRVSFADVECEEKKVEHFDNPNLWWKRTELEGIRSECLDLCESSGTRSLSTATANFLNGGYKTDDTRCSRRLVMHMSHCSETRGLENYIVSETQKMMVDHVKTVLRAQQAGKFDARQIRKVARGSSKPARELALRRAQHDRKESQRAVLMRWENQVSN